MTWFRVDDKMHSHPKVMAALSVAEPSELLDLLAAIGLWTLLGSHCADYLTDGAVEPHAVYRITLSKEVGDRLAGLLVKHAFWELREGGGWLFCAWPDYQPTRKSIEKTSGKRAASGRSGGRSKAEANGKQTPGKRLANGKQKPSKGIPNPDPYPYPYPNPSEEKEQDPHTPAPPPDAPQGELALAPPKDPVLAVFEHWASLRVSRNPRVRAPVLDDTRRKAIRARLAERFTVDDLKAACSGLFRSRFHLGDNDQRKEYLDVTHAMRSAKHVEDFCALAPKPKPRSTVLGVAPDGMREPEPERSSEPMSPDELARMSIEAEAALEQRMLAPAEPT